MTAEEAQLVIGAVTDEGTRGAALDVMLSAGLLTPLYVDWYRAQSPLRQSAEWARGGFLLLQVDRVRVNAAASPGGALGALGAIGGGLFGALLRPIAWTFGAIVAVLLLLALVLRR